MRLSIILAIMLTVLSAQHREALLIGNNNYRYISTLDDPSYNLTRLKKSLEGLDFNVKIKRDLNSENLEESIELFQSRLARHRDTIGFLYYTGHGCQVDHQGYLIPTDVKTNKRLKVKHHALNISEMIETLKGARNRVNMLFLDACRDVPIGTKGSSKGLGQIKDTPDGTLVMYATKAGDTAEDNSDFINSIIKSIQEPKQSIRNLPYSISDIFKHKRTTQKPIFSASDIPKIVLNGEGQTLPVPKPSIKPQPIANPIPKPTVKPIQKYSLTITTVPSTKKIYITNIKPKYKNGIMLQKGKYTIKIKKDGYQIEEFEVDLQKRFSRKVFLKKKKKHFSSISKWITPKNSVCKANGGEVFKGVCRAKWKNSKKICRDSGGSLPSRNDFKHIVTSCGGKLVTYGDKYWDSISDKNLKNKFYQSCYSKQKGFSSRWYWTKEESASSAWNINLYYGFEQLQRKSDGHYIRCIR